MHTSESAHVDTHTQNRNHNTLVLHLPSHPMSLLATVLTLDQWQAIVQKRKWKAATSKTSCQNRITKCVTFLSGEKTLELSIRMMQWHLQLSKTCLRGSGLSGNQTLNFDDFVYRRGSRGPNNVISCRHQTLQSPWERHLHWQRLQHDQTSLFDIKPLQPWRKSSTCLQACAHPAIHIPGERGSNE